LCSLHGYKLFSEEICNEYADQTMLFQIQAFPTEKKPDFVWLFLISKKSQRCSKKARISKSGFKNAKLATLVTGVGADTSRTRDKQFT